MQALQQHLDLLNAQKDAYGENAAVRQQILETEQKILSAKFSAIDDQLKADLAANVSQEDAARKKELAVTSLLEQETIKRIGLEKQKTTAVQAETTKQLGVVAAARQQFQRLGGANSPIIGMAELSSQMKFLPDFSLDAGRPPSGLGRLDQLRDTGPPQLQLERVRSRLNSDIQEGNRLSGRGGNVPRDGFSSGPGGAPTSNSVTNNYVTLQNQAINPRNPTVIAAVRTIIDAYCQESFHKGA
ncbi:hypothetical protein IV102_22185 [bacterium]|nr:hypothetical protein [bacterium]